ncbi:epoxide hydrolase family protein [Lentzea flaviverrucosa]|uniref:Pimeloyl-ACP methyl ester carboxylesterase n=1 Tax=Lentzea flaviverrucosa TaxID=200379 RepID=A0A1H9BSG7_9PSEU|nr:epoxide hydrolase [Lentzea flaviverrucosa]RDI31686.1 pimeloyl-ACP methyl ester carboxylesterase [Lentzea flaviverrucosa]SEP91912.1 Pimeloyl-ACP methyl ester carboxylesterase [Lentzea flaviverrucosa]
MTSPSADDVVEPFTIAVPDAELLDLRSRLAATRWPDRETVPDGSQGPQLDRVRALCDHWATGYDWRRTEKVINDLGSSRTVIDGIDVHFLHVRSAEPDAVPLLLCHGWPGSVLEFRHLVGPLTDPVAHGGDARDAFHVVIPSMPGFGFSGKPTTTGWNTSRVADAWITLMRRLGHDTWFAQGGDWGSAVVEQIARKAPERCLGVHFNLPLVFPTEQELSAATAEEQRMIARAQRYQDELSAYAREQATRPQTIGYSLADSPAGLAAWIYTLFQDVTDSGGNPEEVIDRDEILDDVMLYWLPNAAASSARLYWEESRAGTAPGTAGRPNPVPAGFSVFPGEAVQASRRWVERRYETVVHYDQLERGGHFAALEQPDVLTGQIRTTFRGLRVS